MQVPSILKTIAQELEYLDAKAILVGGAVRDHFLKLPSKDYDVEVYGLDTLDTLEDILSHYGSVNLVGKSFGVLKFSYEGEEYDFSFPRKESKSGKGHRGFDISINGELSYKEASRRRDFSINAIGFNILTQDFLDPFNGLEDIKNKVLRHIDSKTFIEDPLRVYRAVQFVARFSYTLSEDTFALCQEMVEKNRLEELAKERVYIEWTKLLLKSPKPSQGFELMKSLGITKKYFPELHALIGIEQSPKWHPEGDVWIHTMMCVDEMAKICKEESYSQKQKLLFLFAILCHDLGKATHTSIDDDGRIRAIGHEEAGIEPTKTLMYRLSDEHDFIASILPLVEHHLKPSQFYRGKAKASAFRRLATKVNIQDLVVVAKADFLGRTTKESLRGIYEAGIWMLEKSKILKVDKAPLDSLLQGRDLISLGLKPSKIFKEILDEVYQGQLNGEIVSRVEALEYVREKMIQKYKMIDLFCGIGGVRKGFELSMHFTNVLSAEIDKYACMTYEHLYGENPMNDVTSEVFKEQVEALNYDVLLAGFPCQSFSIAGAKKGFKDTTRGTLFFDVADILKRTQPKAFLLENVEGLFRHDKGKTFKIIIDTLIKELGYKIVGVEEKNGTLEYTAKSFLRKTVDFGLPQKRTRTYIMGFRNDLIPNDYTFEALPKKKEKPIFNNIYDLLEEEVSAKYYLSEQYIKTLEKHKSKHKSKGNGFGFEIVNIGESPISNTLLATGGSGKERNLIVQEKPEYYGIMYGSKKSPINDKGIRVMTPIEWARLQGFKDYAFIKNGQDTFSFPDKVSDTQQYKQLGNSVSIPVIEELAKYMYQQLEAFRNKG